MYHNYEQENEARTPVIDAGGDNHVRAQDDYLFLAAEFGDHVLFTFKTSATHSRASAETDHATHEPAADARRDAVAGAHHVGRRDAAGAVRAAGAGQARPMHGLEVMEMAQSDISGNPVAVRSSGSSIVAQMSALQHYLSTPYMDTSMAPHGLRTALGALRVSDAGEQRPRSFLDPVNGTSNFVIFLNILAICVVRAP